MPHFVTPQLARPFHFHSDLSHLIGFDDVKNFFDSLELQALGMTNQKPVQQPSPSTWADIGDYETNPLCLRVESMYEPVTGQLLVARGKYSIELVVGTDGVIAIRWNMMGNVIIFTFKQCKSAEFEVQRGHNWMRLKWEHVRAVGFNAHFWCPRLCPKRLLSGIRLERVPKLEIWLDLEQNVGELIEAAEEAPAESVLHLKKVGPDDPVDKITLKSPKQIQNDNLSSKKRNKKTQ